MECEREMENTNNLESVQNIAKQMLIEKALADKENWGVHESHCCPNHGCKYGDPECPVVLGLTEKHSNHCEMCEYEEEHPHIPSLIKAYCEARAKNTNNADKALAFMAVSELIDRINENPKKVIARAKLEGWWR